jgi:CRISPR-associated protein Cas2
MLEIAPGVYTSPKMNRAVRERVWTVLEEWFNELGGGGIVMTWLESLAPGGQQIAVLGSPSYELYPCGDVFLARKRDLRPDDD